MESTDVFIDMAMVVRVGELLASGQYRLAECIANEWGIDCLAEFLAD